MRLPSALVAFRVRPESMSGGVLLLDYDRDGWLDIYFTNAPTIAMALKGEKARGALYHNNHDGTFTDVTDKAGIATPCFAMGGAVADYNNDGWPDLYITCLRGNVLYRNNGDGTFTDVTAKAGVADGRWSTGAAFADYDGDGFVDLMVANYTEFDLEHPPEFGSVPTCKYMGIDVQCGPRGLRGSGDSLCASCAGQAPATSTGRPSTPMAGPISADNAWFARYLRMRLPDNCAGSLEF